MCVEGAGRHARFLCKRIHARTAETSAAKPTAGTPQDLGPGLVFFSNRMCHDEPQYHDRYIPLDFDDMVTL
jgi:hypothetical protein